MHNYVDLGSLAVTESFVSTPNCTNAVCPNDVVEIQCIHTNVAAGATVWRGVNSTGTVCEVGVNHFTQALQTCTQSGDVVFSVDEISSSAPPPPDCLSSNATITVEMFEGLTVQCFDSLSVNNLIGSCSISFYCEFTSSESALGGITLSFTEPLYISQIFIYQKM